jgi:Na+/proline symporter
VLVTNHALAGAAIGAVTRNPAIAFGLGVASHFGMDALPHWGPDGDHPYFIRIAVRDGLAGLAVLAAVTAMRSRPARWSMLAGALGAVTPDLDKPYYELTGRQLWPVAVNRFHSAIQRESPGRMPVELAAMVVLGGVVRRLGLGGAG